MFIAIVASLIIILTVVLIIVAFDGERYSDMNKQLLYDEYIMLKRIRENICHIEGLKSKDKE